MPNDIEYQSKIDRRFGIILIILFMMVIGSFGAGIWFFTSDDSIKGWSFIGSSIFLLMLIMGLVWPVRYTLLNDSLLVRHGLAKTHYKYEIITGVKPSRNLLSSPALSLDRLRIDYKSKIGFFMISPNNKVQFMQELSTRAGHLDYVDGEVRLKTF